MGNELDYETIAKALMLRLWYQRESNDGVWRSSDPREVLLSHGELRHLAESAIEWEEIPDPSGWRLTYLDRAEVARRDKLKALVADLHTQHPSLEYYEIKRLAENLLKLTR